MIFIVFILTSILYVLKCIGFISSWALVFSPAIIFFVSAMLIFITVIVADWILDK